MELYINNSWTERYGNAHIAQAIAWSENDNHATIYTLGPTAEERTPYSRARCANSGRYPKRP
jgi:hypothetical protein